MLGAGPFDVGHHPGAVQDLGKEEQESAVALVKGGARDAPLIRQVQQVAAHVGGIQLDWRLVNVAQKPADGAQIGFAGFGAVVTDFELGFHPVKEGFGRHDHAPRNDLRDIKIMI